MFSLRYSSHFRRDLKYFKKDKNFLSELEEVLDFLAKGKTLPEKYKNHSLKGEFVGCFDCHIRPDTVLIYKKEKREMLILLLRMGSHSDLF